MSSIKRDKSDLFCLIQQDAKNTCEEDVSSIDILENKILRFKNIKDLFIFNLVDDLDQKKLNINFYNLFLNYISSNTNALKFLEADLLATFTRDPACKNHYDPILFFKGYKALQLHRLGHWLWNKKEYFSALATQSLISELYQVDIHPSCVIGKGIMIDHATRVVIGERVLIGDNISLLHSVTIIAPKVEDLIVIEDNVLISAGASIIGNINIKKGAKVGAGSLVIENVSEGSTVVGVPSRQL